METSTHLDELKAQNLCEDLGMKFLESYDNSLVYEVFGDKVKVKPLPEQSKTRVTILLDFFKGKETEVKELYSGETATEIEQTISNYYFA